MTWISHRRDAVFDPESFDPELMTEGLMIEGLMTGGLRPKGVHRVFYIKNFFFAVFAALR